MSGKRMHRWVVSLCALTALLTSCQVHIVGDSTAGLVMESANNIAGVSMTGVVANGCGYGHMRGGRIAPSGGYLSYPNCIIDPSLNGPEGPGRTIVAFVSLHDAMCSVRDGCQAPNTARYQRAHDDLRAFGAPVVWVEVPLAGDAALQQRITDLNAAVAAQLGCTLVPADLREAELYDEVHYTPAGALTVALRVLTIDSGLACP